MQSCVADAMEDIEKYGFVQTETKSFRFSEILRSTKHSETQNALLKVSNELSCKEEMS